MITFHITYLVPVCCGTLPSCVSFVTHGILRSCPPLFRISPSLEISPVYARINQRTIFPHQARGRGLGYVPTVVLITQQVSHVSRKSRIRALYLQLGFPDRRHPEREVLHVLPTRGNKQELKKQTWTTYTSSLSTAGLRTAAPQNTCVRRTGS